MIKEKQVQRSPFNSLRVIGERIAYLIYLVGVIAGLVGLIVAAIQKEPALAVGGLLAGGLAGGCRLWLEGNGRLVEARDALDGVVSSEGLGEDHVERLVVLLQQWDRLEHQRGSPEFDPWAVQAIRHDIRAAIQESPALERLFQP